MGFGSVVSSIGTTMNDMAAVWTMTTMTSSPFLVSLIQTMSSLPLFLLALPEAHKFSEDSSRGA